MAGALVDRATSDALIGPDWALNIEICDTINRDPGLAKEVVKTVKKRIGHKNSKVQLLSLTLLETLVKNCGDLVHMHVAEKDVLHEMVKIAKKKPDYNVKEKILMLIDTWQEAFGGPRARYPQYYAAYQELLRAGAVFPQRSAERTAPIFTPPQTQPLRSYPPTMRNPEHQQEASESSIGSDLPALGFTEIQNARGIMDVLSEMLNALDPGNREGLRQEVIVDLVDQCHTFKKRTVHLINTTSDEDLLVQGLALNDDLQNVLAKHDAIASGIAVQVGKPRSPHALADAADSATTKQETSKEPDQRSSAGTSATNQPPLQQLLLPVPPVSSGLTAPSTKVAPNIDLLSGEDYSKPAPENSSSLVPANDPYADSASGQNILAFADMFSQSNTGNINTNPSNTFNSSHTNSQFQPQQPQQTALTNNFSVYTNPTNTFNYPPAGQMYSAPSQLQPQSQQTALTNIFPASPTYSTPAQLQLRPELPQQPVNGGVSNLSTSYQQGSQLSPMSAWNGQVAYGMNPQQQPLEYDDQEAFPPPPWETQPTESSQLQTGQLGGAQPPSMPPPIPSEQLGFQPPQSALSGQLGVLQPQPMQNAQFSGIYPTTIQGSQPMGIYYPQQQMYGGQWAHYAYGQQQAEASYIQSGAMYPYASPNELSQRMHGLSMQSSNQTPTSSSTPQQQLNKPSRPEDKLFGDLVDLTKTKQNKPTANKVGSL